jgi:hypothetical protein
MLRRVALGVALALLLVAAPARAGGGPESGVVVDHIGQAADPAVQETLQQAGVRWVRLFVDWPSAEPARGQYNDALLSQLAVAGAQLHARKMKFSIVVNRSPSWASGSDDPIAPPIDPTDYATMIGHLAGTLRGDVDAWEIWNEEDTKDFWAGGPDPDRYVALLKPAYAAIKAAAPGTLVILGPLTANNYPFLEQLYAAGAGGSFDAVADHTDTGCLLAAPYDYFRDPNGRVSLWSFLGYRTVHEVMAAHGDGGKPIYLTEFGWNTSQTECDRGIWAGTKLSGVSEAQQAEFIYQTWHCLSETPYVQGAFWFDYQDTTLQDTHNGRYGLLRYDGSHKPAFAALADVSRHGNRRRDPCGDFTPPSLSVRVRGLVVTARAADAAGVRKIKLRIDGRMVRLVSRKASPPRLRARVTVGRRGGRVSAEAYDRNGNRVLHRVTVPGP